MSRASGGFIARVRRAPMLSQAELAHRAGTSRPTLSAYEHGRKSPSLDTLERLVAAAGQDLEIRLRIAFRAVAGPRGRVVSVPTHLPRLDPELAFIEIELPVALNWSQPGRVFRTADRSDRARPEDIVQFVDGVLLVDQWDELVLPRYVRAAWDPLVQNVRGRTDAGVAL